MKKYIVTFLLIGTFGLYSLYMYLGGNTDAPAVPATQTSAPANTSSQETTSSAPPDTSTTKQKTSTQTSQNSSSVSKPTGQYKDGTYTGISANAFYGNIQVEAIVSGGKLTDVQFLQYPNDRGTSIQINRQAMPYLKQEAIQAQSANVATVSGASDSSGAFRESLASALSQAKTS